MSERITFRQFMYSALYDENRGYYMTDRSHFGRTGDFNTTSQFHEVFGQMMAAEFARNLNSLGGARDLVIIELGPGNGDFAHQVLTEMSSGHAEIIACLRYVCCEVSPVLQRRQKDRLSAFSCVTWISNLDEIDQPVTGVVFSNEFFDALPVHVIRQVGSELREVYVAHPAGVGLAFEEDVLSSPGLAEFWRRVGVPLSKGQLAEINLEAVDYLRQIAAKLEAGYVITSDYGDLAEALYTSRRPEGTLRCFSQHRLSDTPLESVGEQDMTASVNFSALIDYGNELGLEFVSFEEQIDYLLQRGLLDRVARAAEGANDETTRALAHRLALKHLLVPGGIASHFKVLVQRKG